MSDQRFFRVFLLMSLAIPGCRSDAGSSPDLFDGEPWTLSGPEVTIGSTDDDPDYIFGSVIGLEFAPDGRLYSLHAREASVRRWTPDGHPDGTIGRAGEGPGEFREPWLMGFFGDSLWVWDWGSHVSYFDLDSEFLGRVAPRVDIGSPERNPPRPTEPLRDGTFFGMQLPWSHEIATGALTESAVVHMDPAGETLATIWMHPHEPRDGLALLNEDGSGGSYGSQPFGDGVAFAVVDDGIVAIDRRAWTGEGEAVFTLTRIGLAGDTVFRTPVPYTPDPLPRERIDAAIDSLTEDWFERMSRRQPGLTRPRLEARMRDATYQPAYVPPVGAMMIDEDGNIWLRRFDPVVSDDNQVLAEWWVCDPTGAALARAWFPTDLQVMHINHEYVWGVERDELDLESIVRYRLVRGA